MSLPNEASRICPRSWLECQGLATLAALVLAFAAAPANAHDPEGSAATAKADVAAGQSDHGSLAEVGAKLSNPISNVWAHFTQFGLTFSDGDLPATSPGGVAPA